MKYRYCLWDGIDLTTEKQKERGFCCVLCECHYTEYFNKLNPEEPNGIYN